MVAFCKSILSEPKTLSDLIAGSIRRSSDVILPFPAQGNESAIHKLERREKRLLEMCSTEAISITELKAERAKIRAEVERLRLMDQQNQPVPSQRLSLMEFVRLVVKSAVQFDRIADPRQRKEILVQIFSEVFFRCERRSLPCITAFRFNPVFVALMDPLNEHLGQIINLEKPFRNDGGIPEGFRRCKLCTKILPVESFKPKSFRCRDCLIKGSRERWQRHAASGAGGCDCRKKA